MVFAVLVFAIQIVDSVVIYVVELPRQGMYATRGYDFSSSMTVEPKVNYPTTSYNHSGVREEPPGMPSNGRYGNGSHAYFQPHGNTTHSHHPLQAQPEVGGRYSSRNASSTGTPFESVVYLPNSVL